MDLKKINTNDCLRRVANHFPPVLSAVPMFFAHYIEDGRRIRRTLKKLGVYRKNQIKSGNYDKNTRLFVKTLKSYCVFMNYAGAEQYIDSYFFGKPLTKIRSSNGRSENDSAPILLCCVYNDLKRVKEVVKHHRQIGIKNMVFLDNMSNDGTFEWLLTQEVDLYRTDEAYHAGAKSSWIRKLLDIYGYNRWYLIVDSDELFTYIGMEEHPIQDLIAYAEEKGICRIRSLLLDMYSNHSLYEEDNSDFLQDNRYFDTDSYWESKYYRGMMIRGGPRTRVFTAKYKYSHPLTKYPLIYMSYEDAWADHTPLPYNKNFSSECLAVLRHYKFLKGDFEKYSDNAKSGKYNEGSKAYKLYISAGERNLSFFYEASGEYIDSNSLRKIHFLKDPFEGEYRTGV